MSNPGINNLKIIIDDNKKSLNLNALMSRLNITPLNNYSQSQISEPKEISLPLSISFTNLDNFFLQNY